MMTHNGGVWYSNRSVTFICQQLLMLLLYCIWKLNALTNGNVESDAAMINNWQHSTHCSWYSSGGSNEKIIQKVNLICASGNLRWHDPIGGMHVRFLMSNMNDERICLQIHFIPAVKVFYHILDGNSNRLLNAASLFQKCMNNKVNITLFIESHSMQIWRQRFAGFRYEILPEWLITDKISCGACSSTDIINAFCNYADFVFEGRQNNAIDHILIDKILRRPLHHQKIVGRRWNQDILRVPIFGCLPQKGKTQRVYIAKMDFDMARIICSPLVSEYMQIAHENSQNTPCQLL